MVWKKPSFNHLRIWGSYTYMKRNESDKLGARSDKYNFFGYPKQTKGNFFYHPIKQKVFDSKNATFLENKILLREVSGSKIELCEVQQP